jgi:hypothetical protein
MTLEKKSIDTGHGGARSGAGRPKGTGNKLTAKDLLLQCEATVGKPFAVSLMEGYRDSIQDGDTKLRSTYEKIIIDKVATTMFDVEVEDNTSLIEGKQTAFIEAIKSVIAINNSKDVNNASD